LRFWRKRSKIWAAQNKISRAALPSQSDPASETDKLIDLIQSFPIIWKTDYPNYGKRGPRESAYKKVAESLAGRSGRGCLAKSTKWLALGRGIDGGCHWMFWTLILRTKDVALALTLALALDKL